MLTKAQKAKIVDELTERFRKQKIALFSDFRGVSVGKAQMLRRALKKDAGEYKIAKKTLLNRALKNAGMEDVNTKKMEGEIGVAFGYGDEVAPARVLYKFSRENETFKIVGGVLAGKILGEKDIITIAKLPSREVLIAQVVGTLQAPIRGLATVLSGNMRNLVVVLNKIATRNM